MSTPQELCENLVKNAIAADQTTTAISVMRNSTGEVLKRMKASLDTAVKEQSERVQEQFCRQIADQLQGVCNAWIDMSNNQFMIVPEGTRFVHRDGNHMTILVEQKPTVRQIRYSNAGELSSNYSVSVPFMQFFCSFENNRFTALNVTCSKTPVNSLVERQSLIPFPNCSGTHICTGNMNEVFSRWTESTSISKKVSEVIAAYWGSAFNNDLNGNMISFFRSNFKELCKSVENSNYNKCFAEWEKKSVENPMWAISQECIYSLCNDTVMNMLPQSVRGNNGKLAIQNNIRQVIDSNLRGYIGTLTTSLQNVDLNEENRNQPHVKSVADTLKYILGNAYNQLWTTIHRDHEIKVTSDQNEIDRKRIEVERLIQNSKPVLENIDKAKEGLNLEKLRLQCELYKVYQHLQSELQAVQEMKSKLSQHFDAEGNALPAKRRGRPRKEPLPAAVAVTLARVGQSSLVVGPDGQPVKRGRGRPRKNPVA